MQSFDDRLRADAHQEEAFDDVAGRVLVIHVQHVPAIREFLRGGGLHGEALAAAGLAVHVVDRAPVEQSLSVLPFEHGGRGRQVDAPGELREVLEPPRGRRLDGLRDRQTIGVVRHLSGIG